MDKIYYFDNAATTFPKPEYVKAAMIEAIENGYGNAGRGSYKLASDSVQVQDRLRKKILEKSGSQSAAHVILTSGATIAINMLLGGIRLTEESVVYVSPFEHNAVIRVLHSKHKKIPFIIKELPLSENGWCIDLEKAEYEFLMNPPDLICISNISNVTGYILPVADICQLAKSKNEKVITVVDGCQAMGLIPKPLLNNPHIDYYIFAGHKTLYGPFGIGGIICNTIYSEKLLRSPELYEPYLCGGTGSDSLNKNMKTDLPEMLETGSMDMLAAKGLLAALEGQKDDVRKCFIKEKQQTEYLTEMLMNIDGVKLYAPDDRENHISIVSFNVAGYTCQEIGMILDEDYNIAVRTGYHCAPLIHTYLKDNEYNGTVRASIGRYTTREELDYFVQAVKELAEEGDGV